MSTNLPAVYNIKEIVKHRNEAMDLFTQAGELYEEVKALIARAENMLKVATKGISPDVMSDTMRCESVLHQAKSLESFIEASRVRLDGGVWARLLTDTQIRTIMDHTAMNEYEESLGDECPEVTVDTAIATIEGLLLNRNHMLIRGVAEIFSKLDKRFKSHDAYKVDSRVVLTYAFDEHGSIRYGSGFQEKLIDMERVISVMAGKEPRGYSMINEITDSRRGLGWNAARSEHDFGEFRMKVFKNGNAHLWFTEETATNINKCLREYYGEVLSDAVSRGTPQTKGTSVSKDLQFYPTPKKAVEYIINRSLSPKQYKRILEPSAGKGNIVEVLRKHAPNSHITAIEFDRSRADHVIDTGYADKVLCKNFFDHTADGQYDLIVMNPPFYGTHYMHHVYHAFDMLEEDGYLVAILPVTADLGESSKHKEFQAFVEKYSDSYYPEKFIPLPSGTFKESGTNVNTVYITLRKP